MSEAGALFEALERLRAVVTYRVSLSADGDWGVSVSSLALAGAVLLLSFRASRLFGRLLERRVLGRSAMDQGLRYAVTRLAHYAVVALGCLLALRVGVGLDLTNLAVVVTALSVGIGLGLKEIASDVAAGFILLFERPARVGDRVKLSGDMDVEGDVVSINLRTTKVFTNDGLVAIVPNSQLTNRLFINWSFSGAPVRVHVPVGVAYGSDVDRVRDELAAAARGVPGVLEDPAPSVRLVRFGESSLDFELLVWTTEPTAHPQIASDLNFNIERGLREAGIAIPFPQREVRLLGGE